jgi:hypothetical protein
MIHRLSDRRYLPQAFHPEMGALSHQAHDRCKAGKVASLGRSEWVRLEKRDNAVSNLLQAPDAEAPHILAMIVLVTVNRHLPTSEERLKCVQHQIALRSLYDRKLRLDLPAEAARSVSEDRDAEASLAVDEADDPLHS